MGYRSRIHVSYDSSGLRVIIVLIVRTGRGSTNPACSSCSTDPMDGFISGGAKLETPLHFFFKKTSSQNLLRSEVRAVIVNDHIARKTQFWMGETDV